jgi:hypothetical protein
MSDATQDLIEAGKDLIRKPADWMSGGPISRAMRKKEEYTDMHAKMVDKANQSFKDAAAKEQAKKKASKKPLARKR